MTAVAVTFNGTRLNSSDSNTGWGNYNSGGGAPASEAANAYQISTGAGANTGAVGKKVNSTSARIGVDYNGSAVDYTAAANRLFYGKIYIADAFDLNTVWGVEIGLGSADNNNKHTYNVAGSGANRDEYLTYPPQGGLLIAVIDPTIDAWRESETGTLNQAAITWYALGAQFQNGNAKSENVALDAIDYGTGLTLLNGTGADPEGRYTDYVVFDQGDINNRWGAAVGKGNSVTFRGIATVGSSGTAVEFNDIQSVVTFPDGYHSAGLFGVNMNIQNAASVITDGCLLLSAGQVTTEDTRADYIVIGTAGAFTFSGTMRNFRNVEFTSVCSVVGARIQAQLLTQGSASIVDTTLRANAVSGVAFMPNPTFGASDLRDSEFVQTGAGHAFSITTPGTYTLSGIGLTGFGGTPGSNATPSSGPNDAAFYNNSGGLVTLNIVGGSDQPAVRNGAGATTVVNANVSLTLTGLQANSEVRLYSGTIDNATSATELDGVENSATTQVLSYSATGAGYVVIAKNDYENFIIEFPTLPTVDTSIPVQQRFDRTYRNP